MKKICFVICPIKEDGSEVRKRSDKLLEHIIEPVCTECGFQAVRVDLSDKNEDINEEIRNHLRSAPLAIADMTDLNPNVFYEIGYRDALGLETINIKEKDHIIPFDVITKKAIDYFLQDPDELKKCKLRLIRIIKNIDFEKTNIRNNESDTQQSLQALTEKINQIESQFSEIASDEEIDEMLNNIFSHE